MYSAVNAQGEVSASSVQEKDGPFFCPICKEEVILKKGRIKMPHFAHYPDSTCSCEGAVESREHRQAKQEIYDALARMPNVSKLQLERGLNEVRPDISCVIDETYVAIEVQVSTLSPAEIERRTLAYTSKNIAVLWTSPFSMKMFEDRYAPEVWERYLHTLYFGKVYYWSKNLTLCPVHFGEYMLPPSRYSNERRSKRFVTPIIQSTTLITDLAPVWRKEWKSFPAAKLWCLSRM